jgi:stage III sporulation protein AD
VLFICGSCIVLILILIPQIKKILNEIDLIFKISNFPNGTREILLKVLGICLLTQFGADFCRSREEIAISNKVELAGKIAAILAALPLFKSVIEIALNFLKN